MRKDTSGLMFTQNDNGSIIVEVCDYGVSEFGGGDWEGRFDINKENAEKLYAELCKLHKGSFEEMLIAEFDKSFHITEFIRFCKEHDIKYYYSSWF